MVSREVLKLFQVKKLGQWKQRESFGSDKFTSLCVVDMMIICSIYFHSYGKIIVHNVYETSHLSYFCAATKEWFPLLPLESCCKSDKSFTYCLFIGNSIYMCIQYVYISVYIYIPGPSNVKLGRPWSDRSLHKRPECTKSTGAVFSWGSWSFCSYELRCRYDVDTHMNWFDFIFYPNLNLKCLKLSVKFCCQTIVTFRWWSSPSIWQEISVTQLHCLFLFFPPMSSVYRELGRFRSWLEKPEVPPSPFAYGGSSCISADPSEMTQGRPQTFTQKSFFI